METEYLPVSQYVNFSQKSLPWMELFQNYSRTWMVFVLVSSDIMCLIWANLIALLIRGSIMDSFSPAANLNYLPLIIFFLILYARRGLYSPIGVGEVEEIQQLTGTTTIGFLVIGALTYFLKSPVVYSRLAFGITWILALGLVPFGRFLMRAIYTRLSLWGLPVMVIGQREEAEKVVRFFKRSPKIGIRPVGMLINDYMEESGQKRKKIDPSELCHFCIEGHIKTGLVVSTHNNLENVREEFRDVFELIILVNGEDNGLQLSGVTVRQFGGIQALVVHQNLLNPWSQITKRVIDFMVAGFGLLALSPLYGLIAALIKIDSPGRVFYRQLRVGKDGIPFTMLKFRTMHMNADQILKSHLDNDPALNKEWNTYQKLIHDPRITRVGQFLRRYSIDEIPQLWNVLVGEMSLVGPRPIMIHQKEIYGFRIMHYERVTPGITGMWQISGRNQISFEKRSEFDVEYVMSWSVWLDIYILLRTFWVVIRHDGAN